MKINWLILSFLGWAWTFSPTLVAGDSETPAPENVGSEKSQTVPVDPLAGGGVSSATQSEKPVKLNEEKKPPLTAENSNLNLATDLELETLDTREKVFLPAGTYRQILRIPIDSPTMQTAQKIRQDRSLPVKLSDSLPEEKKENNQPLWIRYESLEKIKINEEERRGGLDLPVHGPADLKPRLWYAKSEGADWASSLFYFVFGGLGYSTANLLGWSAGNTREIPGDFEYRLIRR